MAQTTKDTFLRSVFSECADVLEKHIEGIEADAELDSSEYSLSSADERHGSNVDFLRSIYDRVSSGQYSSWSTFFADIQALHQSARREGRGKKNVLHAVKAVLLTAERLWKNTESGHGERAMKERTSGSSPLKRKRDEFEADNEDLGDINTGDEEELESNDEMEEDEESSSGSNSESEYGQEKGQQRKLPHFQGSSTLQTSSTTSPHTSTTKYDPSLVVKFPIPLIESELALDDQLRLKLPNPLFQDEYGQRPHFRLLIDQPPQRKASQQRKQSSSGTPHRRKSEPVHRSAPIGARTSSRTPSGPSKRLKTGNDSGNKSSARLSGNKSTFGSEDDDIGQLSVLDWNKEDAAILLATSVEIQRLLDRMISGGTQAEVEHVMETTMKHAITESELDVSHDMLGSGKFAQVYRGMLHGRPVAVKCFITTIATVQDFNSEVIKLSNLVHPNIVEYLGYIPAPTMWIVMELMDRGSLFHVINEERPQKVFAWSERVMMAIDVCSAMTYLHSFGVRHCDLNSKNLLVNFSYQVKIADFGLSQVDENLDNSPIGKHLGTLRWMSPEMIRKECRSMEKADVWSFGVVMIEIATQEVPYPTFVEADVKYQVSRGNGPTASDQRVWAKCPGWKMIMETCFNVDYAQRPSFKQLLEALKYLQQSLDKAGIS